MKKNPRWKAVVPLLVLLCWLFAPCVAAQTRTDVDTGRFGAEEPEEGDAAAPEKGLNTEWLYLGLRAGPSLRVYTPANDTRYTGGDTRSVSLDIALAAGVQALPFLSIQAEMVFTWDNASLWAYRNAGSNNEVDRYTKDYTAFSLQIPVLVRYDFYPGRFRLSPFLGAYCAVPLGKLEASNSLNSGSQALSYEISPPFGLLGGLSGAMKFGPGILIADLRYAADLGEFKGQNGDIENFKRSMVSLTVGYEFGFFTKKKGAGHE